MADLPRRVRWEDVAIVGAAQVRDAGIGRLDLGRVAADLQVTPEAVRYWCSDETELLLSIMKIRQRWFLDEADARLSGIASHTEKLGALVDLCVADHDVTYWIELWKLGLRDQRAREARQTLIGSYRDLFSRVIRAGQRAGEFASVSPAQVALVLVAMVTGLSVEVTVSDPSRADQMHEVLIAACERMLEVDLTS
jgi:BetI-type transcriptional repressor, C-terminal